MMKTCQRCGGSGTEPDPVEIGSRMRERRKNNGLTLREMATRLGFSAAYICDLELGRRGWNASVKNAYIKALR